MMLSLYFKCIIAGSLERVTKMRGWKPHFHLHTVYVYVKDERKEVKRYELLFTCVCSRAIRIKALDDLTTLEMSSRE